MKKAYEIVKYQSQTGVSDSQILTLSAELQKVVREMDGYIGRELTKTRESVWMDIVQWESLEQAEAAANNINELPIASQFMSHVKPESVTMEHFEVEVEY